MNNAELTILVVVLGILFGVWLIIRSIVLWYFRINRVVELLEQIERNTRPGAIKTHDSYEGEYELYSINNTLVTNKRLVVPPNEWPIKQFQPVRVEAKRGKFQINLVDINGNHIHLLESDNEERTRNVAEAINKALG